MDSIKEYGELLEAERGLLSLADCSEVGPNTALGGIETHADLFCQILKL